LDYFHYFRKQWEANNQDENARYDSKEDEELRKQLIAAPWTAEEHPNVAQWLEERSPVLDLFGVAVRKPNFATYRWNYGNLYAILLPDVQANRQFGRELSVRVTERLGRGDIDGAWYDVMSILYLSRKHYIHDPFIVVNLVGMAIEEMGRKSAELILRQNNLTPEQLERFAQDLDSLPRNAVLDTTLERNLVYSFLSQSPKLDLTDFGTEAGDLEVAILSINFLWHLPFDRNIAGKRIAEFNNIERRVSGNSAWDINRTVMQRNAEVREDSIREKIRQLKNPLSFLRIPLIRTRSQLIADSLIVAFSPALEAVYHAFDRTNTHFEMLRLAVALERYKADNEKYPQALNELVPKYLIEVPLEPFTGRQSFVYQPAPDADTAFLIHSAQWDEKDGLKKELFLRMEK